MNSLRNCARTLAREIQSAMPAGPNQTLAMRHVEDASMRRRQGHFGFKRGELYFPKYRVSVDYRLTDVILADVHELRGNFPITEGVWGLLCVLRPRGNP